MEPFRLMMSFVHVVPSVAPLVLLLACSAARAQFINGSFEQDGQFSFEGWRNTHGWCAQSHPFPDAPPDGGTWSLQLHLRNVQASCYNVVYQVVPQVVSGEIWQVTAWARREPDQEYALPRLYWTKFEPFYDTTDCPLCYLPRPHGTVATTTLTEWTVLTVVDTFYVASSDSVGVVLDAYRAGGPIDDWCLFDLVSIERIGVVSSEAEATQSRALELLPPSPNPVRDRATATFRLGESAHVRVTLYDLIGRERAVLSTGWRSAGYHTIGFDTSHLPAGPYFLRLEAGGEVATRRLTIVR